MKTINLGERIKNYEVMVAAAQVVVESVNDPANNLEFNPETVERIKASIKQAAIADANNKNGPTYQREGLYACCAMVQVILNFDPKIVFDLMAETGILQTIHLDPTSAMGKNIVDAIKDDINIKTDPTKVN